jgi:surface antigen
MSNLSKLKLGKFVATIVALSSISAILSTAKQAEAFPAPTILSPGSSVRSNNQCFSLNAQPDGNLVLYKQSNGQALWHTATYGRNVKQTIFQTDGNLVIYNTSNQPVWASGTDRRSVTQLIVQDDGNVVMYNSQNQAIWATNTVTSCGTTSQQPLTRPANSLINNTIMPLGSSIKSNNQCFNLSAQSDGNLVIYRQSNGQALWNTATYGRNVKQTIFQPDGNLVIYNTSNQAVWASNTDRRGGTRITLQDDGNFVMYNAQNQALWATNTVTSCNAPVTNPPTSSQPSFNDSEYRNNNIFWNAGYAPGSTNPPNPKLGNALGNCTWYASGRAKQFGRNSARVDRMGGNASQWGSQASAAGIAISSQPQVGAIAQWDANSLTPYGHVAVVEKVNSNGTVLISESSYGSGDWNFLYRTRIVSSNSPSRYILP